MGQSRLTLNVNCQYVKDWGKTLAFLKRLDPVAVVAVIDDMNARNRIYEIKQALPNAKITARCIIVVKDDGQEKQLDGSLHLAPQGAGDTRRYLVDPVSFVDTYGELGRNGLRLAYMNEPQATHASQENIGRMVQHMIETIAYANQTNTSLELGGFGVGHPMILPNGQLDARFDDVLILMSKNRDRHALAVHLYAPVDTFKVIDAIIARYKVLGMKPCRIHVSEFGFDTAGSGDPLNGFKSRGYTGEQFADWCTDKVKNLFQPYIADDVLFYVAVFGWGYDASFPNFDVETDIGWQGRILAAKDAGKLTIESRASVVRPTVPAPANKGTATDITVAGSSSWNLRTTPEIDGAKVGLIVPGETLKLYMTTTQPNGGKNWYFVERANAPAAESVSGWIAYVLPVVQPDPPVVVDPPPVGLPAEFLEVSAEYAMRMYRSELKIGENMRKEAASVLASNVPLAAYKAALLAQVAAIDATMESNVLHAQDLETGAQMHINDIAQDWKWIAEQTQPPVAA